jgi:membrane-bound lytic murein transglycosylase B
VRRTLAVLLAAGAFAAGVAVAAVPQREGDGATTAPATTTAPAAALPAPSAALPRDPAALAAALTATVRRLRPAVDRWDPARPVPHDVTLLALHHQRILRLMSERRGLGNATLARLPGDVRGGVGDIVTARRELAAIPRDTSRIPPVRVAPAAPAATLRKAYAAGRRRFGVPWSVLAAVNMVESSFGRVRSASEAGARGPMQFLPSTWRAYGLGGDIDRPRDAILGAANLLAANGARRDPARALYAYNHSVHYVRAVRRLARRMARDDRAFRVLYAWQVYARTKDGVRRLTGPGR